MKKYRLQKRPVRPLGAMSRSCILFLALLFSGCTYWPIGTYFSHGISQYHGDGTIRDVSQRSGLVSTRGYVVTLGGFDLGSAYDRQFKVVNLPTIEDSKVEIALAVERPELSVTSVDDLRKKLEASLSVSLTDSTGTTVTTFSSKIGRLRWSSAVHGYSSYWLYDEKGSFFTPKARETYFLHVQYSPDSQLQSSHGCIYLYSGCGGS